MATIIKEIEVDVSQLNRFAAIVAKQYDKQFMKYLTSYSSMLRLLCIMQKRNLPQVYIM